MCSYIILYKQKTLKQSNSNFDAVPPCKKYSCVCPCYFLISALLSIFIGKCLISVKVYLKIPFRNVFPILSVNVNSLYL